jgi:hypothetical protein
MYKSPPVFPILSQIKPLCILTLVICKHLEIKLSMLFISNVKYLYYALWLMTSCQGSWNLNRLLKHAMHV